MTKLLNLYYIAALIPFGKASPSRLSNQLWLLFPGLAGWAATSFAYDVIITDVSETGGLMRAGIEMVVTYLILSSFFYNTQYRERALPSFIGLTGSNTIAWGFGLLMFAVTNSTLVAMVIPACILIPTYYFILKVGLSLPKNEIIRRTIATMIIVNIPGIVLYPIFI